MFTNHMLKRSMAFQNKVKFPIDIFKNDFQAVLLIIAHGLTSGMQAKAYAYG